MFCQSTVPPPSSPLTCLWNAFHSKIVGGLPELNVPLGRSNRHSRRNGTIVSKIIIRLFALILNSVTEHVNAVCRYPWEAQLRLRRTTRPFRGSCLGCCVWKLRLPIAERLRCCYDAILRSWLVLTGKTTIYSEVLRASMSRNTTR